MCDCISYNHPDLGGTTTEIVLQPPPFIGKDTVCIDACMVDTIKALWGAGVVTRGSCCGHNGAFGRPSVVVEAEYAEKAARIVPLGVDVLYWELRRWD